MKRLTNETDVDFATRLCTKLATDLDANDLSSVDTTFQSLGKLPVGIFVPAIKAKIGIDRLVKHNLDENEHFSAISKAAIEAMKDAEAKITEQV